MSSVSSVSSSSSIYGSRNVNILSGLASGLDTESMIEGLIESYENKISNLEKDRTTVQWQQEELQKISNLLIEFNNKYNSYTSTTNLASRSFFTNSSITETLGEFADKLSASGQSSSEILINSVAQIATASTYKTNADDLMAASGISTSADGTKLSGSASSVDLNGSMTVSELEGSLSFKYGTKTVTIEFDELEFLDSAGDGSGNISAEDLKTAIEEKLADKTITFDDGSTKTANEVIGLTVSGDTISLSDLSGSGNTVEISGATDKLKTTLGVSAEDTSFTLSSGTHTSSITTIDYLKGKSFAVDFNGKESTITIDDSWSSADFASKLNEELAREYGEGKINVSLTGGALEIDVQSGSTFRISSEVGEALGFGKDGEMSTYLNTSATLKDLGFSGEQTLEVNGVSIGTYGEDTALETIMSNINSNSDAGVSVSYSTLTNQFVFTADETGEGRDISFGGTLGVALFGDTSDPSDGTLTKGTDAVVNATVNGENVTLMRSSNTFEIDGMDITVKETFNKGMYEGIITNGNAEDGTALTNEQMFGAGEAVKFSTTPDSDLLVDTIKDMVDDYNEIMKAVKSAYSDTPLEQSNGEGYDPLTSAEKDSLSESEYEAYEEKAKTGILFMDNELSTLYASMRQAVESLSVHSGELTDIGITVTYQDGLTQLSVNETELRSAINEDPDKVMEVFTDRESAGAENDGFMASLDSIIETYAKTTGEPKGLLITRAGSVFSPTSAISNEMLSEMNEIDEEIETWQSKMLDKVDYYTAQFARLEVLINEMNSQSSALAGLMGY